MNLVLDPRLGGPLYRRLFLTLRQAILDGTLAAGDALPPSRDLGAQLQLSRNTVLTAYDLLKAEGYVQARQGSGLYVSADFLERVRGQQQGTGAPAPVLGLSGRGQILASHSRPLPRVQNPAFLVGLPDLDAFPFQQWQQCLQPHLRKPAVALLRHQDAGGLLALKTALRDYLRLARGLRCTSEQIILVNGSQAGLDLIARMLLDAGDGVIIEDPCYPGAREGLLAAGARLLPVPVDAEGLDTQAVANSLRAPTTGKVRLLYTTASHQFPLGGCLPLARRLTLLELAQQHDFCILEDDYDAEFRFDQRPISSLQGLDQQGRVIYLGTFSKVMFPGLRLGYLVVPTQLAAGFAQALRKTGQDASLQVQAAMASFIERGHFHRHLRRMRQRYGEKQQVFVALLKQHLGDWLDVTPDPAGMQLACRLRQPLDMPALLQKAQAAQLNLSALAGYYLAAPPQAGLYLGYAGVPLAALAPNVLLLQRVMRAVGQQPLS